MSPPIANSLVRVKRAEVRLTGPSVQLDDPYAQHVGEQLSVLADAMGPCELVLDLGNVESVCAAALGVLLRLHRRLTAGGGRLRLRNVGPQCYRVFEITKLHAVLDVRPAGTAPTPGDDHAGVNAKAE